MEHRVDVPRHVDVGAHVVVLEHEALVPEEVSQVVERAGEQVVDHDDLVAPVHEGAAQVRPEEPCASGDDDPPAAGGCHRPMPS